MPRTDANPSGGAAYLRQLSDMGREAWEALDEDQLQLVAFQQCLYFGATREAEVGRALSELFPVLVDRLPTESRRALLDRVVQAIDSRSSSILALLPFLQHERDVGCAREAALAFAERMPAPPDDPLAGPRTVLALIEHADDDALQLGLLAGVLDLCDPRLLPLLRGRWRTLSSHGREALAQLNWPLVSTTLIEFLLDWLEDADDASRAGVTDALVRLATAGDARVIDLERVGAESPAAAAERRIVGDWSAPEFGRRIEARLRDLARREDEPRRLPSVLAAWGLAP